MAELSHVRDILISDFLNLKSRNFRFSMRAYAKRVGVPQSAISEVLNGKRRITKKLAYKILNGIGKSPAEVANIISRTTEKNLSKPFRSLDIATFNVISEWYYYAILSLAETVGFQSDSKWIARRLNLSVKTAQTAIDTLVRLELLEQDAATGKLTVTGEQLEAMAEISTPALKRANRQNLELASEKLENTQFEERDFTAITLTFDPSKMKQAKEMIKAFRRRFCQTMESNKKEEVYKLCIQLFPLTQRS